MVDLPQPTAWSEFAQADEPPIEKLRGWPLLAVYAVWALLCLAGWCAFGAAIRFFASGV